MKDYKKINKESWNQRTTLHLHSDFYDIPGFRKGQSSLDNITFDLIGDITNKKLLHLQCHFGLDTLSLARLGAQVTGMDLSDKAIAEAKKLANQCNLDATFICCDLYDLPQHLDEKYDIIYTSYGVIGWLPDIKKWAKTIAHFLKPGGQLIFIEFHPVVWMFDDDFKKIQYRYFNSSAIYEEEMGSYAALEAPIKLKTISWNHSLGEVVNALITNGIVINALQEYDYTPYNSFSQSIEVEPKRYQIKHLGNKIPMVYSLIGTKAEK